MENANAERQDSNAITNDALGSNPDWLRVARESFSTSTTYFDNSIRRDIEQDIRAFQGQHPMGSKYLSDAFKSRSKFFRPKTRATIRKGEATAAEAFFSTDDVISMAPRDDEDPIQVASAAVNKELLQYRLTETIPWFIIVNGAYQEAMAVGVVCSYQCWEYDPIRGIDRPAVHLRPPENIRIDPGANWIDPINSSPFVIDMMPMYVKDVRARMQPDMKTGREPWFPLSNGQLMTGILGNSDSTRLTREGPKRMDSKDQPTSLTDYTTVWVHRNIVIWNGIDYVFYTLGVHQLLSNPVPLKQEYLHGLRPYTMGVCQVEAHRLYPSGVARLGREIQGEINNNANQRADNVSFAMNKRYFVKRGKRVDLRSLIRNVPSSVTLMDDPEKDVNVIDTPDVTNSAYLEQDRLNLDFDDVTGSFSQSSVQANRNLNETVGGMNILTANANKVDTYQLRTFIETWVEPTLRQLAQLEQQYETDAVILSLAGRKAKLFQKFGQDAVTDQLLIQNLTLRVNVGLGTTSPTEQVNRFLWGLRQLREILADGTLEKYGMKIDEVMKEIFGKLGYKDGRRFFTNGEEDPVITHLKSVVQELQRSLEQKQDPAITDAMVRKMNAEIDHIAAQRVKIGVESSYSAMETAGVIATTPLAAPIADTIMMAAGYVRPTPAGQDPNFGQGPGVTHGAGISQAAMQSTPEAAIPQIPGNTSPMLPMGAPAPTSPTEGVAQGIETAEVD